MKEINKDVEARLKKLRRKIDRLDQDLLKILRQRWRVIRQIGLLKIQNQLPIFQKSRRQHLLLDRVQKGRLLGLRPELVETLFQVIQNQSVLEQRRLVQKVRSSQKRGSK